MKREELKNLLVRIQEKAALKERVSAENDLTPEETAILLLASRWNPANTYCNLDRVRRVAEIKAGPMKIVAYTVANPETLDHGKIQFHMTWDNTVMALMGEDAAKLFARFIAETLVLEIVPDSVQKRIAKDMEEA